MQGQLPPQLARGVCGGRQVLAGTVLLRLVGVILWDIQALPRCRQVVVRQNAAASQHVLQHWVLQSSEAWQQGNNWCRDVHVNVHM